MVRIFEFLEGDEIFEGLFEFWSFGELANDVIESSEGCFASGVVSENMASHGVVSRFEDLV